MNFEQSQYAPCSQQYDDSMLPVGVPLIGTINLSSVQWSAPGQESYVSAGQDGLLYFNFELAVVAPAQYAGCKKYGKKPLTMERQTANGPNFAEQCAKGDRAVAAILATDAMVKNQRPNWDLRSYEELNGKVCAFEICLYQGRKYVGKILSPNNPKDGATLMGLAQQYQQALRQPQQQYGKQPPPPQVRYNQPQQPQAQQPQQQQYGQPQAQYGGAPQQQYNQPPAQQPMPSAYNPMPDVPSDWPTPDQMKQIY